MNMATTNSGRKRKRTKQTLAAPRRMLQKDDSHDFKKLVWVLVGKTEHQAWLLEEMCDHDTVLVRWESTRLKERVSVLSIRLDLPGRSSRRKQAQIFRYDESFEIEGSRSREVAAPRRKPKRKYVRPQKGREEKRPPFCTNQAPLQRSFLPEKKIVVKERSTLNDDAKPISKDPFREKPDATVEPSARSLVSSNNGGPLKKRDYVPPSISPTRRSLIIPGTEFLDDMALVSHFMSILSRLDDQSEYSDDEEDDNGGAGDDDDVIKSPEAIASRKGRFAQEDSHQRYETYLSTVCAFGEYSTANGTAENLYFIVL
jgi:hypothetical protein